MAIRYYKIKRKIFSHGVLKDQYVARIQVESVVTIESIAKKMEKQSSITRGDFIGMLADLEDNIFFEFEDGHPVALGHLGTFYPAIDAIAVDTPEEVKTSTILRFRTIFKASKYLKERFKKIRFVLGDNIVREVNYKRKKK